MKNAGDLIATIEKALSRAPGDELTVETDQVFPRSPTKSSKIQMAWQRTELVGKRPFS